MQGFRQFRSPRFRILDGIDTVIGGISVLENRIDLLLGFVLQLRDLNIFGHFFPSYGFASGILRGDHPYATLTVDDSAEVFQPGTRPGKLILEFCLL